MSVADRGTAVEHVAILRKPYLDLILAGAKTVEARLYKSARAPVGRVRAGEVIWFKQSGGPYRARGVVSGVHEERLESAARVRALRREFDGRVLGGAEFWEERAGARHAVLVSFGLVTPIEAGPSLEHLSGMARRAGWHVLPALGRVRVRPSG